MGTATILQGDGKPYVTAAYFCDLLQLAALRRLGCPWGEHGKVFTDCCRSAPLACLRWLVKQGCPVDWDEALWSMKRHNRSDDQQVLAWLHEARQEAQQGSGSV